MFEVEVDGSFFEFTDSWQTSKIDEWPQFAKLTAAPYQAKACDLVALNASTLWLIEAKDYSYPGAQPPPDLVQSLGLKFHHSLAVLHAVARWGVGDNQEFSERALAAKEAKVCLAVELPDGGRRFQGVETALAALLSELKPVTKKLGVARPVVSNSFAPSNVPWGIRRNPETRAAHKDR